MNANPNQATLAAYNARIAEYVAGTPADIGPELATWINKALSRVPAGSVILEVGSGTGRDAAYIEARDFTIIRSDASEGFVAYLRAQGNTAILLDALTDDLGGPHNMVFADAVILHFTRAQAGEAFARIRRALRPGGVLACSLKQGDGEGWSSEKLGVPRYFCYWQPAPLSAALTRAGFRSIDIDRTSLGSQAWLMVTAIA